VVAEPVPAPVVAAADPIAPLPEARTAVSPAPVRLASGAGFRRVAPRNGKSRAVVQLGAFSSRDRIQLAWNRAIGHAALRGYTPVSARYDGAKGTVYRLSIKGFASDREARELCNSLKRSGKACFVRAVSGDAPIQFASR
jgi:cell division septation protein DedD